MADFKFEIVQNIGVLSTKNNGWTVELNIVKWGDNSPKFDIRSWDKDHAMMSKGISLNKEELKALSKLLSSYNGFDS